VLALSSPSHAPRRRRRRHHHWWWFVSWLMVGVVVVAGVDTIVAMVVDVIVHLTGG